MELHIQIKLDGDGLPDMDALDLRYTLEDRIEDLGYGEVIEAGGGLGVMDIFVQVDDPDTAEEGIATLVAALKLSDVTRVTRIDEGST
ncbi:MAG: hypothetical protein CMH57_12205 [Myxococcales bacterium]|nr:hypothetical protein [Myxococcales bacterium]